MLKLINFGAPSKNLNCIQYLCKFKIQNSKFKIKEMASLIITGANGNLGLTVVNRLLKDGFHLLAASGQAGAGTLPEDKNLSYHGGRFIK